MPGISGGGTIWTEMTLRYSDMDPMGHLNNAVYATFFEAGRVAYVEEILGEVTPAGAGYVIVKLTIAFKAEARYPGTLRIRTRISRVGGSSMTYVQDIFSGERLLAEAESVCALFDLARRKAMRCPQALRDRMQAFGAES
jgi:acyl-CoA thioester hydrolase